ncbi:MAG: hydroxylamine reductase, partial [Desulfobacterales bacterium]|nr:hydroxylamine reductase [Desulfobacterales bacterium]
MFCYQCEQTAKGEGCTKIGVCGKQPDVAALQDLLNYVVKGLSQVAVEGRKVGVNDPAINQFTSKAIFSTLTNVDFDPERFVGLINDAVAKRDALKAKAQAAGGHIDLGDGPTAFVPGSDTEALVAQGEKVGIHSDPDAHADIVSLRELLIYGIRGMAAYADHAAILGHEDDGVYAFMQEGMAATLNKNLSVDDYIALVMKCGEVNLRTMELLDAANTGTYGHPVPTAVPLGAKAGKAILVSG